MNWTEDEEAWVGAYNGFVFSIAFDGHERPSSELITFARETLGNRDWIEETLDGAKQNFVADYGARYSEEIRSLEFGTLHFLVWKPNRLAQFLVDPFAFFFKPRSSNVPTPGIIANLSGGKDCRSWWAHYTGKHCDGIGFDS
jgi:hypothetical protein